MSLAIALHVLACAGAAALLHRRILSGPSGWSFALLFAGALFVPVLGVLGIAAVALATPRGEAGAEREIVATRIPRPPGSAATPSEGRSARGGLQARLDALASLRPRTDPGAIALLRRGLRDDEEDARLLAHALLESKGRAAYRAIEETEHALATRPERRAALHQKLAAQHWELAWLGLVQGECLDHALATAQKHALAALDEEPASAAVHFLLGRIHLRMGAPEQAEAALLRARELGAPANAVGAYLAEAAFLQRRFDLVRSRFAEARGSPGSETVARMRRYWA